MNDQVGNTEKRQALKDFGSAYRTNLLTLLFTDLVGSTDLKQRLGDVEAVGLIQEHHRTVRDILDSFAEAKEVGTAGDSFFIVFARPSDAVTFALLLQKALRNRNASARHSINDRVGIHVGEVVVEGKSDDFYGMHVDACARVMSLAVGGQILMSRFAFDTARQVLRGQNLPGLGALIWHSHGKYELKGIDEPVEICEVGEEGAAPFEAPKTKNKIHDPDLVTGWRPALSQTVPGTKWVLTQSLGEGGFGEVWVARHHNLKEERVFKFCFQAERARSLRRELSLFRLLREKVGTHPHIVGIQEVNLDEPPFYLVMERASGNDLKRWFTDAGGAAKVPLETRLEIVAQIAEALQVAHDAGVIHRDIKPANILIHSASSTGAIHAKITDFGIGQVTSQELLNGVTSGGFTETLLASNSTSQTGTLMYMAPELLTAQRATPRSDTYALGIVLFQLATGDLNQPVTTDWQDRVDDPLLREDLSLCLKGNPADRISTGQLAQLIRTRPSRLAERERKLEEQRARERQLYRLGIIRAASIAGIVLLALALLSIVALQQAQAARELALKEKTARQFAEAIVAKQMERTRMAGYSKISQLLTDALAQYSGQKKILWGLDIDRKILIKPQEYTEADGTKITTFFVSAGFLELLDLVSRAAAIDVRRKGFLADFIASRNLSVTNSIWFDPIVWDEDVLNESVSYFNGLLIFLGCLETQKISLAGTNPLNLDVNTLILKEAAAQSLKAGALPSAFFTIWATIDQMGDKPEWAVYFSLPTLTVDNASRLYNEVQDAFFQGTLK